MFEIPCFNFEMKIYILINYIPSISISYTQLQCGICKIDFSNGLIFLLFLSVISKAFNFKSVRIHPSTYLSCLCSFLSNADSRYNVLFHSLYSNFISNIVINTATASHSQIQYRLVRRPFIHSEC